MKYKIRPLKALFLAIVLLWTLFPIYWMLSLSIRSNAELTAKLSILPHSFTFSHFVSLFKFKHIGNSIVNSLQVASVSLAIAVCAGVPCAYIFSRARFAFRLKKTGILWVLLLRVLPPIAFAIPLYVMMNRIGLLGTKIPIVLSHILLNIPFIIWYLVSFFANQPKELEESAKIDGAGEWTVFLKIILPLILPGLAAVLILTFMTSWNEYLYGVIFVQKSDHYTVPLILATLNSEQELAQWGNIAAGGVLSVIPVSLFVLFAQTYLIKGLAGGAVKG